MTAASSALERQEFSPAQLSAMIDALNFCLADDWDESSHEHGPEVYQRALEKLQAFRGRVLRGGLRVALEESNLAWQASDTIARYAEAQVSELRARVKAQQRAGDQLAEWVRKAMRFIDLCDADADGYDDLHEDAERLTTEGYSLFGADADVGKWCLADLEHRSLTAFEGEQP